MDDSTTKLTHTSARSETKLIRACITIGGLACAVWLVSNALAVSVYLFDRHSHSHRGFDVFIVHSAEVVASLFLLRYYSLDWRDAGFRFQTEPIRWFSSVFLVVLLNLSLAGVMRLFQVPNTEAGFSQYQRLLLLCVYVPFSEEVFVRGWFQAALLRCSGEGRAVGAVLGSSIFFAGTHAFVGGGPIGTMATVVGAFLMGLIAGWLRQRTGSLVPAVAVHAVYNITGLFLAAPIYSLLANVVRR